MVSLHPIEPLSIRDEFLDALEEAAVVGNRVHDGLLPVPWTGT